MFSPIRSTALILTLAASTFVAPALAAPTAPAPATPAPIVQETKKSEDVKKDRAALKHYDLGKKSLGIEGYDPVAYFPDYGGKPTKGSKKITTKHRGVLYRFASEKNKKAFLADPERFEPAYGGWCAWAMTDGKGDKTEIDPKTFSIEDGRLYLFYNGFWGNTLKSWNKKGAAPKLKANADKNWKRISGEAARPTDSEKKKAEEEAKKRAEKAEADAKKGDAK